MAAAAQVQTVARAQQAARQRGVERDDGAGQAAVHIAVTERPGAVEAAALVPARGDHAAPYLARAGAARAPSHELERRHLLDLANEIDAVEQRSAEAALIAPLLQRGARAVVRRAGARAAVAGREHDRIRRKLERALAAHDLHPALLERLAQSIHRAAGELRQLVEEQDPAMRERDLARPRPAAAADQALSRDGVVRRSEGALGGEASGPDPGRAVDLGDLQRLLEARRREDARHAPREHGLAGAGRPDHQHVVAAGGGDLQGTLGVLLPSHVREVDGKRPGAGLGVGDLGPSRVGIPAAVQKVGEATERRDPARLKPLDQRGLCCVLRGHEEIAKAGLARAERNGQRAPAPA